MSNTLLDTTRGDEDVVSVTKVLASPTVSVVEDPVTRTALCACIGDFQKQREASTQAREEARKAKEYNSHEKNTCTHERREKERRKKKGTPRHTCPTGALSSKSFPVALCS